MNDERQVDEGREDDDRRESSLTRTMTLVLHAKKGDDQAFNRLFARYYDRVRKVVRARLGGKLASYVESEDILQNTFISAVRGFDNFDLRDEASFINWLSKIAEREILTEAKYHQAQKRDRRKEVHLRQADDSSAASRIAFEPSADLPAPADAVAQAEQEEIIEQCLSELPERYREVIIQHTYIDAPWEMVAEELGCPTPAAARKLHSRAVVELTKQVRRRLDR